MIMKNFSKIVLALSISALATSCSDWLETTPKASLDAKTAISNVKDAQVALNGVYDAMQTSDYYGRNFLVIPDAAADNLKLSASNSGRFLAHLDWQVIATSGDNTGVWNAAYNTINRANNIIVNIDAATGAQVEKDQIKGAALMLRALAHFDLVRLVAQPYNYTADHSHLGVPYMESPVIGNPVRNTVAEVYSKIERDLTDAISLMTVQPANATSVSKWAAKALLSKVYLYEEKWDAAATLAEEIIATSPYVLATNAEYPTMFTAAAPSKEAIFELMFTAEDNNATNQLGYIYIDSGYGDLWPTADVIALFSAGDARLGWFYSKSGVIYTQKFVGRNASKKGQEVNTPILRLSEVYLIAAEALAEQPAKEAQALPYLNAIVQRARPTAAAISLGGDALKDRIQVERRKELLFEGNRLWDLTRRKLGVVRGADCTSNTCSVPYPNDKFAYPIPQRELDANPNMVQNPGYGS